VTQKTILVTNIPTPYRIPLFNVLHKELANKGIDLKVVFDAVGYARRQWRIDMSDCLFPHNVLSTKNLSDSQRASFTYQGLLRLLEREQPSVIVTNGFSVATTKIWLRSFMRRTPYIIWSGAIKDSTPTAAGLRRLQRKLVIQRATGFVAYGSMARDYLLKMGASEELVRIGINTVDTAYFRSETAKHRQVIRETAKNKILFIGELIPRKGVDRLLRIIQALSRDRQDFVLDLIGSGSEQSRLEQRAGELGITDYVNFVGFKQKADLPYHMSRARCFVFPTYHDIWGLVLVEAMAAGLPCVSSINAGATSDLIRNGETGFAVDFSEIDKVKEKIRWLLDHPDESELMGQRAAKFIEERAALKNSAGGFVAAIEESLGK
jgi:glycosyltransferase involved in cell wall biosynthesis